MNRIALIAAVAVTSLSAIAQAEPVGDGLQLDVDLVDRTLPLAGVLNLTTPIHAGYHFGNTAVLVGAYVARGGVSSSYLSGGTTYESSGSLTWVELAPSVRYHLKPLEAGALSPFVLGEIDYVIVSQSSSQTPAPTPPVSSKVDLPKLWGFALGGGAEYLVSKNFGLSAAVELRYLNYSLAVSQSPSESKGALDALCLGGTASVNLHF